MNTPGTPPDDPRDPAVCPVGADAAAADDERVLEATRAWLTQAVIGLNFCPFANATVRKNRLRMVVSQAREPLALLDELHQELKRLLDTPESTLETTLLIVPQLLSDFLDFNDFLDSAEALLSELGLEGTFQIASFHPHYQFAGTTPDDVANATNQSPFPTLHLLRESSIDRAVAAWGEDTDRIFENNIARLEALGPTGWQALSRQWQPGPADTAPAGNPSAPPAASPGSSDASHSRSCPRRP
ncbi:MAG: DUF1415 domain-containing protein [Lautropia sp.]|nr:DUF1415 domain-containing protein [Lautropia sp.]